MKIARRRVVLWQLWEYDYTPGLEYMRRKLKVTYSGLARAGR